MPNPLVAQGTLNRLRASVFVVDSPELNVSASFTGEGGISLALEGDAVAMIGTMTGRVTSPEPYMNATVSMTLLKTQGLSDLYKQRIESDARIGDVNVTPDSSAHSDYYLTNCAIIAVREMSMAGKDPAYNVVIGGTYNINESLWEAQ